MTASFGLKSWQERVAVDGDGEDCLIAGLGRQSGLAHYTPMERCLVSDAHYTSRKRCLIGYTTDTSRFQDRSMAGHINMGIISIQIAPKGQMRPPWD